MYMPMCQKISWLSYFEILCHKEHTYTFNGHKK